jgi:hypothetical protein
MSPMTKSLSKYKAIFDSISSIPLEEYRIRIWRIAAKTIPGYTENTFFGYLDFDVRDAILSLNDDDYILPIDDDDWLAPTNINPIGDFITWDTYKLHISEMAIYPKVYQATEQSYFFGVDQEVENVLSCCYLLSVKLLKIANEIGLMSDLLLRHNTVKQNILKVNKLTGSDFFENHLNSKLSLTLRHIGSNTSSKKKIGPEFHNTMKSRIKNFSEATIDIPERWMENPVSKLQKLYREMQ